MATKSSEKFAKNVFSEMRKMFTDNMVKVIIVAEEHKLIKGRIDQILASLNETTRLVREMHKELAHIKREAAIERYRKDHPPNDSRRDEPTKAKDNNEGKVVIKRQPKSKDSKSNPEHKPRSKRTTPGKKPIKTKVTTREPTNNKTTCKEHKKYSGIRKPKKTEKYPDGCKTCWKIYKEINK